MIRSLLLLILLATSAHAETFTPQQFGGRPNTDASKPLQKAFDAAAKSGGEVYLSPGTWRGNVSLENVNGMTIRGDSRTKTVLLGIKADTPTLDFRGCWYSTIRDLGFGTTTGLNCGVVEIDSGSERGIQGNTFQNLYINGQGLNDGKRSTYAMTMCRIGGNSAQGSEQLFLNCHFAGASQSCYFQQGYNALNNTFIGGNFQNYDKHGIELVFGSLHLFSVGFQSTTGYAQVDNDGWDIKADSGGVNDALVVSGCRTESLRFIKAAGSQPPTIVACNQVAEADPKQPPFNVVDIHSGTITNCYWTAGTVRQLHDASNPGREVEGDYQCSAADRWVLVEPKNDCMIRLCDADKVPDGFTVTVIKAGGSKGEVCVYGPFFDNLPIHECRVTSSAQFMAVGGGFSSRRWYRVK